MPTVSTTPSLLTDMLAVPLARYAQIVGYNEAAFFGVQQAGQEEYACRTIWTHWQRMAVARALQVAQSEIERVAGYSLTPTWVDDEQHDYSRVIVLDKSHVSVLGAKLVDVIHSGMACNHATDPVAITHAVTFTDAEEVHVYHPGTDYEIIPSSCVIAAGTLTIAIPRVRMVKIALQDNPEDGLDYTDTSNFEATVDIKRVYADTTDQITLVGYDCVTSLLVEDTTPATGVLRNPALGIVDLNRCSLITCGSICCGTMAHAVRVNYLSGLTSLTAHAEDVIVRFAHSRMPTEPCGCDFLRNMWENDKKIPDMLTAERENCPFGLSQGAWQAWTFAQSLIDHRLGVL